MPFSARVAPPHLSFSIILCGVMFHFQFAEFPVCLSCMYFCFSSQGQSMDLNPGDNVSGFLISFNEFDEGFVHI